MLILSTSNNKLTSSPCVVYHEGQRDTAAASSDHEEPHDTERKPPVDWRWTHDCYQAPSAVAQLWHSLPVDDDTQQHFTAQQLSFISSVKTTKQSVFITGYCDTIPSVL